MCALCGGGAHSDPAKAFEKERQKVKTNLVAKVSEWLLAKAGSMHISTFLERVFAKVKKGQRVNLAEILAPLRGAKTDEEVADSLSFAVEGMKSCNDFLGHVGCLFAKASRQTLCPTLGMQHQPERSPTPQLDNICSGPPPGPQLTDTFRRGYFSWEPRSHGQCLGANYVSVFEYGGPHLYLSMFTAQRPSPHAHSRGVTTV